MPQANKFSAYLEMMNFSFHSPAVPRITGSYYEGIDFLSDIQTSKDCRSHHRTKSNKGMRDLLKTNKQKTQIETNVQS